MDKPGVAQWGNRSQPKSFQALTDVIARSGAHDCRQRIKVAYGREQCQQFQRYRGPRKPVANVFVLHLI